ncbi:MAG: M28 family peptidase [Planctomycetes bacterium]|nr:M28 family peptidase [Planctomycetota bacterium]
MSTQLTRRLLVATTAALFLAGAPAPLVHAVQVTESAVPTGTDFEADLRVLNDHVVTLANPFMEGRFPGTRGMEIAKQYFEFYLGRAGLDPAFENGTSYRQSFPLGRPSSDGGEQRVAENVGGLLPGRGRLKDQYIVIGAHLDHLGTGSFGSRAGSGAVHPGADDNASGSAAVLLLAAKLAHEYASMPEDADLRSIVFLGFSAEESGLVGSRFYAEHPVATIEDHDLMINLDMIGRIKDGRLNLTGANSAEGLDAWLVPFIDASELTINKTDRFPRGSSDHASFRSKRVPFLFGSIPAADFHDDYHAPTDVAWKINRDDMVRTVYLFRAIALASAQRPERWVFALTDDSPPPRPRGGARVRIGIQPDYAGEGGILLNGVAEDGPAEKAGLRAGDLIVSWNGTELGSIEDLMPLLIEAKPGDVVSVGVKRDEGIVILKVTLEAAGGG